MSKTQVHSTTFDPVEMLMLVRSMVRFGHLFSQLPPSGRAKFEPLVARLLPLCGAMREDCNTGDFRTLTLEQLRDLDSMIYHIDTLCRRFNSHYPDEESRMRYAIVDAIYSLNGYAYQKKDRYGTRAAERLEQRLQKQRDEMKRRHREKYGDPDGGTNP